jgi:hypothetical protein
MRPVRDVRQTEACHKGACRLIRAGLIFFILLISISDAGETEPCIFPSPQPRRIFPLRSFERMEDSDPRSSIPGICQAENKA